MRRHELLGLSVLLVLGCGVSLSQQKPTASLKTGDAIKELVSTAVEGANEVVKAKVAALNSGVEVASGAAVSAGVAAKNAGNVAVEYTASLDPIAILDDAEASILASKEATIHSLFDAKRQLVQNLQEAGKNNKETVAALLDTTVTGVNTAIDSTSAGLEVTKTTVAEYASEVTLANVQLALNTALNSAMTMVEETASSLIGSLVATKMKMHEVSTSFDSKDLFHGASQGIGSSLNVAVNTAEDYGDQLGVFKAIDGVVHSVGSAPLKFNQMVAKAEFEVKGEAEVKHLPLPAEEEEVLPEEIPEEVEEFVVAVEDGLPEEVVQELFEEEEEDFPAEEEEQVELDA